MSANGLLRKSHFGENIFSIRSQLTALIISQFFEKLYCSKISKTERIIIPSIVFDSEVGMNKGSESSAKDKAGGAHQQLNISTYISYFGSYEG